MEDLRIPSYMKGLQTITSKKLELLSRAYQYQRKWFSDSDGISKWWGLLQTHQMNLLSLIWTSSIQRMLVFYCNQSCSLIAWIWTQELIKKIFLWIELPVFAEWLELNLHFKTFTSRQSNHGSASPLLNFTQTPTAEPFPYLWSRISLKYTRCCASQTKIREDGDGI